MRLEPFSDVTVHVRTASLALPLIIILLLLPACASDQENAGLELDNTGKADIHAVSSERIRVIMQKMKAIAFNRYESALEIEKEQTRYIGEMAAIAEAVGKSAESVSLIGNGLELNRIQQKEFLRLANRLKSQAKEIKLQADSGRGNGLQKKMHNMISTCNSCHDRFRDMAGTAR